MATSKEDPRRKRAARGVACLVVATLAWLPIVHLMFPEDAQAVIRGKSTSPLASRLAARHLALWENPELRDREIARMRRSNAEWDFMGRTFLVLALSNMAL